MDRSARLTSLMALLFLAILLVPTSPAFAFWGSYRDIFPGDRAAGMSGAYTALANDASGVFYNPAGVAAVERGDVSLSANAIRFSTLTEKGALFGKDLKAESFNFIPTSVGSISRLGKLRAGLSIVVADQNSLRATQDFNGVIVEDQPLNIRLDLERNTETYLGGPSLAYPISSTFSVGLTVYYIYGQANQHDFILFEYAPEGQPSTVIATQTSSAQQTRTGFIGFLGFLWKPIDEINVGLTVRSKSDIHNFTKSRSTAFTLGDSGDLVIDPEHGKQQATGFREDYPWSGTLGIAIKPWNRLTLAVDVDYHLHTSYQAGDTTITRKAVVNTSVGAEAYLTDSIPIWLGFFTDTSNLPTPKAGVAGQSEKIDFVGFTAGGGLVGEHAMLAAGVRYGFGNGKGTSLDKNEVIDVDATDIAIFLASRYVF